MALVLNVLLTRKLALRGQLQAPLNSLLAIQVHLRPHKGGDLLCSYRVAWRVATLRVRLSESMLTHATGTLALLNSSTLLHPDSETRSACSLGTGPVAPGGSQSLLDCRLARASGWQCRWHWWQGLRHGAERASDNHDGMAGGRLAWHCPWQAAWQAAAAAGGWQAALTRRRVWQSQYARESVTRRTTPLPLPVAVPVRGVRRSSGK